MNRRKSKEVKRKAHDLMYDWLHTLVSQEDAKGITKDNYKEFFPTLEKYVYHNQKLSLSTFTERWFIKQVYVYHNQKLSLSTFTERWFIKQVKKQLLTKELDEITLQDVM